MAKTSTVPDRITHSQTTKVGGDKEVTVKNKKEVKRYNLALPVDLFEEVQRLADERQTTVVDMFRRFVKLGLLAAYLEDQPDAALIIRDGNTERQVLLL